MCSSGWIRLRWRSWAGSARLAVIGLLFARALSAQSAVKFVGGAALGFVTHEFGHFGFDVAFGAGPYLDKVKFGPIPFFAVAQRNPVTDGQEFAISSGGFWIQEATNEWILSSHPRLRTEHRPMLKGAFVFNVLMTAGYGIAAIGEFGPDARDPRSMAASSGVAEPLIGAMILTPALLDGYRYLHPEKRWPAWASRIVKLGSILLTIRAAQR